MKLVTTVTHDIEFTIEYFEATDGGMDSDQFGEPLKDLNNAVHALELARSAHPKVDWVIVGRAKTLTTGKTC